MRPTRAFWLRLAILLLATALPPPAQVVSDGIGGGPASLHAQQPRDVAEPSTAVTPATISVGDVFRAAIRVTVPPGVRVLFPDTLTMPADVEAAARRTVRTDTLEGGRLQYTAAYPLTAWRPDTIALDAARVRMVSERGERSLAAQFVPFTVTSVLPADTAGIEPQPPKDVFGANRLLWPFLIGLLLVLAALALFYLWRRRRRGRAAMPEPVLAVAPRDRALAALEDARRAGLIEAGAFKEFYSRVSDALRQYLHELESDWGADLTTTELAGRMRDGRLQPQVATLFSVLGEADMVKFAQGRPAAGEALASWGAACGFVEKFDTPATADADTGAETDAEAA